MIPLPEQFPIGVQFHGGNSLVKVWSLNHTWEESIAECLIEEYNCHYVRVSGLGWGVGKQELLYIQKLQKI